MREIAYREAINEAISEEMRRDEKVFLIGEDIGTNPDFSPVWELGG